MYAEHVPILDAAMRADLETFKRGIMFAELSARIKFHELPSRIACVNASGRDSPSLWTFKLHAFDYLADPVKSNWLWSRTKQAPNSADALHVLVQCPGLGVIKGGFVATMMGFDVGCLDIRNVKRLGLPADFAKQFATSGQRQVRAIERYLKYAGGHAAELWDDYCHDVGTQTDWGAEAVSRFHVTCIVPEALRELPRRACPHIAARPRARRGRNDRDNPHLPGH